MYVLHMDVFVCGSSDYDSGRCVLRVVVVGLREGFVPVSCLSLVRVSRSLLGVQQGCSCASLALVISGPLPHDSTADLKRSFFRHGCLDPGCVLRDGRKKLSITSSSDVVVI